MLHWFLLLVELCGWLFVVWIVVDREGMVKNDFILLEPESEKSSISCSLTLFNQPKLLTLSRSLLLSINSLTGRRKCLKLPPNSNPTQLEFPPPSLLWALSPSTCWSSRCGSVPTGQSPSTLAQSTLPSLVRVRSGCAPGSRTPSSLPSLCGTSSSPSSTYGDDTLFTVLPEFWKILTQRTSAPSQICLQVNASGK
jgi:hypothetical protein